MNKNLGDFMAIQPNAPLIVVAMPSELRHALEISSHAEREPLGPWVRWSAELDGSPVNYLLCGIGMVNAGAALSRALCDLSPRFVINYGCAGAHRAEMHPGDVVVGTRYVSHRAVTILPTGEEKHGGTPVSPEDSSHWITGFEADPELLADVTDIARNWRADSWPVTRDRIPETHIGPLTSADTWTQATTLIEQIHAEHGTFCEDMEAAALAQICWMHNLPFLSIKDISNNEFHSATDHGDYGGPSLAAVEQEVGRRAFELVRRIIQKRAM
jgi:adenosylhomocysteine nucleosidase